MNYVALLKERNRNNGSRLLRYQYFSALLFNRLIVSQFTSLYFILFCIFIAAEETFILIKLVPKQDHQ